jgi:hypothetical protein
MYTYQTYRQGRGNLTIRLPSSRGSLPSGQVDGSCVAGRSEELLAPSIVEFFSQEWWRLGDKMSLKSLITKVTGILYELLDGAPLS